MAEFPAPPGGILLTHFIVSDDLEPSVRNRDEDELAGLQFSRKRERAFLRAAAGLTPAVEPAPKRPPSHRNGDCRRAPRRGTFSMMPGWRGTLAQRASIAIGLFYVVTGSIGLIVNPDRR